MTADSPPGHGESVNELPRVSFLGRFTVLRGAARELWVVFGAKLLGTVAYSVMNTTFVFWLSYDLGYRDETAGFIVAVWSTTMTLAVVFVGSLTDAIGLRKTLLLGLSVSVIARGVMTFTTVKWLALAGGMLPLAVGEALGVPVLVAGTRRYSTTAQRSIAFAISYAMMNAGFLVANFLFDYVRSSLGEPHGRLTLPWLGIQFTTYRALFLVSFLFELSLLAITYFTLRDGVEATDEGLKITSEPTRYPHANLGRALWLTTADAWRDTKRIFTGLWRQPGFYKFLAFLAFAAFVRLIFIHMYYTYPKFGVRELGEGAPVGRLFAINSFAIILLAPLVGALSQRISAYKMVSCGSAIAAASVFIMTLPPRWFQPLADGPAGHLLANNWLGGYSRISVDDFLDLPALAAKLQSTTNRLAAVINPSLSEATRVLLRRVLDPSPCGPASDRRPSSSLLAPGDIHDLSALVKRLREDPVTSTRPLSQRIWSQLTAASRALLSDPAAPAPQREAALVRELNGILHGAALGPQPGFAGVALSEAARFLQDPAPKPTAEPLPNQSLLLNRLLLEDVYPENIPRSSHPLRVALGQDLTRLIQRASLRKQSAFGQIPLSPETQARLAQAAPRGSEVRLNRLLLEDAFPGGLARNRVGVPSSVSPYYVMIVLYILLLSIGESIYSPRLYEYAAAIAPKGQEASYMSLSYLPFFLAKLLVASFSGILLARYCPETGPRDSSTLWLIIALTTLIAPIGLLALRRWIQVPEAGRTG